MSERMEELAGRLVVRRKRDGRCVYDEQAKAELVAECFKPGVSVARLAREAGVNANQLSRWMRELSSRRIAGTAPALAASPAFIPVAIAAAAEMPPAPSMSVQARMPNGVVLDLHGVDLAQLSQLIEALGRLRCSVSTKG